MAAEIKVPALGESVTEATIGRWFKKTGESVKVDEPLVELETDKVTIEVPSPAGGVLGAVNVQSGQTVKVGAVLGVIESGEGAKPAAEAALCAKEKTLFSLRESILLYDLTSTYFEGLCLSNAKAKRGYSRDSRPDCKQVVVGLVLRRGGFSQSARNLCR